MKATSPHHPHTNGHRTEEDNPQGTLTVLNGRRALVVDDDEDVRNTLALLLQTLGYASVQAEDGMAALKILAESAGQTDSEACIGLVLLDIMMPWLNGTDLCWMIKEKYQVPVIMVTAKGKRSDVMGALQAGANDYLVKPVFKEALLSKVSKWLPKG